jgi:hypothetical protein
MDIITKKKTLLNTTHKYIEGLSTGCLVVGYMCGVMCRGIVFEWDYSVLFFVYIVHWCASFVFHLNMSIVAYNIDRLLICVVSYEMVRYLDGVAAIVPQGLFLVQRRPDARVVSVVSVVIVCFLYISHGQVANGVLYLAYMAGAYIANMISDSVCTKEHAFLTSFFTTLFHVLCGVGTYHASHTCTHIVRHPTTISDETQYIQKILSFIFYLKTAYHAQSYVRHKRSMKI